MTGPGVVLQLAAVEYRTDEAIAQARKLTHDRLIEGLGPRRRSGVRWREATGAAAISVVRDVDAKGVHEYPNPPGSGGYQGLIRFLEECPDAVLVIAECDV